MSVFFAHQKMDQGGNTLYYTRHIYDNPLDPLVSVPFALSLYFTTFNTVPPPNSLIFPGERQYARFAGYLDDML